uniref:Uncharacterized protein n=1 Tax=Ascaris lumbricoides TaxID=6252 RepID=A0A9J2P7T8_ASCLU
MSVRRSSRTHKPPKWIEDFEPYDTSTPIHSNHVEKFDLGPLKGATSEVEESSNAHVRKQANLDGKAATIITPATTSNHIMTHPKSKKPSRTSQAVMVVNKRAQQARDRSRSRSRGRKSTPIKSARRMPVSESVVSPTLSEISSVMPTRGIRRSTRLAERSMNGFADFDNSDREKRKDIIPAVTSHNNTSFFRMDLLSNKPRLMTFLQVTVLLIYLIVFYKLCIHFGADKFVAHLLHKLG